MRLGTSGIALENMVGKISFKHFCIWAPRGPVQGMPSIGVLPKFDFLYGHPATYLWQHNATRNARKVVDGRHVIGIH